jgi:prefoldin subunit 5
MRRASQKIDRLTEKMDQIEQIIQSVKGGMGAFTKSLAELLRPFYNCTSDKAEGIERLKEV